MAMAVSKDCGFALTVSADHIVGRYDLVRHRALDSRRSLDRVSTSRTCRRRLKQNNRLVRSEQSIQEIAPFLSVMTDVYAQWEAGMVGESHSSTDHGITVADAPLHLEYGFTRPRVSSHLER